jgi:hypothetical protein
MNILPEIAERLPGLPLSLEESTDEDSDIPAGGRQQKREREIGGRVSQHIGGYADSDAALGAGSDVDIVKPTAKLLTTLTVPTCIEKRCVNPIVERRNTPSQPSKPA